MQLILRSPESYFVALARFLGFKMRYKGSTAEVFFF